MPDSDYTQGKLNLFARNLDKNTDLDKTQLEIYDEVVKPNISLSLGTSEGVAEDPQEVEFVLSRRWEQCADLASKRDNYVGLLNVVRPIVTAQDQLVNYLQLMKTTREGALWVFYGESGSGKTTFLSTLEHQFNRDLDVLQVIVLKADELNLPTRAELRKELIDRIQSRTSVDLALVLILEDREDSIDDQELSSFVQTLKGILRNPKIGENVLVVFPVNNIKNGRRIIEAAQDVGIQQHEGARNTMFTFEGPEPQTYPDIVEDLAVVLNGRPLSSFGLRRNVLENMPKDRITVGNFIQEVAERIQSHQKKIHSMLNQARYKELVTIFVFVRPMEPTDLYTNTQQIVVDSYNRINPNWLLTDGSELNIREWQNTPEMFASIVNGVLHARVVDFPPHVLYQIIQVYGSDTLKESLAEAVRSKDLDPTPTKNQANSRQAVDATNLARLLRNEPVARPQKVTIDREKDDEELSNNTQQKMNLIRKGIITAEWVPKQTSVNGVHSSIARAFKDLIVRGSLRTKIAGYMGVWAESTLYIPGEREDMKTVKPDITIETNDTLYLLEFNFSGQHSLTRADLANYIMRKLNTYSNQLPLLTQIKGRPRS